MHRAAPSRDPALTPICTARIPRNNSYAVLGELETTSQAALQALQGTGEAGAADHRRLERAISTLQQQLDKYGRFTGLLERTRRLM